MADEEDLSDLFAIPDFGRRSNWLLDASRQKLQNPLFALDPDIKPPSSFIGAEQFELPTSQKSQDDDGGQVFFELPSLLKELAGHQLKSTLFTNHNDTTARVEVGPDDPTESLPSFDDDEDFWLSPSSTNNAGELSEHRTWEAFESTDRDSRPPLFISEAGPAAFDALLPSSTFPNVLDAGTYCACLLSLALGRSSILFSWDSEKSGFVKTPPYLRVSGLSLDLITAVDRLCLDCGNAARHLQGFADATYAGASSPTRVALAGAVDRLVTAVRSQLSQRNSGARSILQLQSLVEPACSLLNYVKGLVKKLAQQKSDEGILSCLFQEAQASEYGDTLQRDLTRELLRILSKPWGEFVEDWIGLRAEEGIPMAKTRPGKGFVKVANKMWIDDQGFDLEEADYFLDEDRVPTFVAEDTAQTIFETGRNLRFLREHHPEHPLSRPDVVSLSMPPKLEWKFNWSSISKLETRVRRYQNAVTRAIQGLHRQARPATSGSNPITTELDYFGKDEAQMEANIIASIRQLDQAPDLHRPPDGLTRLLQDKLYPTEDSSPGSDSLSPPWDLVPMLSFGPVIEAQASLVNQECMKLLFTSHHLRTHIDALHQSFLLGNGLLCSRLSHALFDPDLSTAERRSGVALGGGGTMGLRLGGRKTWPPASSELRLALMGVLSECYEPRRSPSSSVAVGGTATDNLNITAKQRGVGHGSSSNSGGGGAKSDLPGELSFAVRDLFPEEIDRCMDPDSLEALDFLRLAYKPPPALRPIIPPALLLRYDRVFRLMLRVLRMLFVANQLFVSARNPDDNDADVVEGGEGTGESETNASLRLRIEARHFIRQVAAYFFTVGIAAPWRRFEAWLDRVEAESTVLGGDTTTATAGRTPSSSSISPDALRARHEQALDEIAGALLLRKRQAPVLALLEEAFAVVLRFAAAQAKRRGVAAGGGGRREGEDSRELYRLFRKKVEVFVTVCRGLGEKMDGGGGGGGGAGKGEKGNAVEQLLVMLDMAGYYGRRAAAG